MWIVVEMKCVLVIGNSPFVVFDDQKMIGLVGCVTF
jgi:hypothetical protein